MCTYEDLVAATLPYGLSPLVVPQLKTITLGGAVTGLGIESASFRNGLPHESVLEMDILTGAGEVVTASPRTARRSLPRLPEFLWHAWLLGSAEDRTRTGQAIRRLRHLRFTSVTDLIGHNGTHHRDRRHRRHPRRLPRRRGVQRRRELPVPRRADVDSRPGQRLHRQGHLLPVDPARRGREARPADHPRLPVALGHRLVLVLAGVRRTEPEDPAVLAAALPAKQRLLEAHRLRPAVRHRRPDREAQRSSAARARRAGHRGADRADRGVPRLVPDERADRTDLAVPAAAARRRGLAAVPDRPGTTPTSTSASGRRCRCGTRPRARPTG